MSTATEQLSNVETAPTRKVRSVADLKGHTEALVSELERQLADTRNDLDKCKTHPNFDGRDTPRLKLVLCVVAGCTTPLLALAMSSLMGYVAQGEARWFALAPATVLAAMLIVSTPHIAQAKIELRWKPWQAWAFAIGLDFAITVCECLHIWCAKAIADVAWLPGVVIWGCVLYSAFLNSYVNLMDAGWSKVQDTRN